MRTAFLVAFAIVVQAGFGTSRFAWSRVDELFLSGVTGRRRRRSMNDGTEDVIKLNREMVAAGFNTT